MSQHAINFWCALATVVTIMLVCHAAAPMIFRRRFTTRQIFYLTTAVGLAAAAATINALYRR